MGVKLPVTIENSHKVTIPNENIEIFKSVMGPVTLFLQGKALGKKGQQINNQLNKYAIGDIVQIVDNFEYQHSGIYKIVEWNLSSKGNIHEFDLGFRHK